MKKYKPKLFPILHDYHRLEVFINLRWVWGGEKYGYCRLRDWPNGIGNPKRTSWIFPRGDLVLVGEDRESQESQKKSYSRVYNFVRNQAGWVLTEDLRNKHPLAMLTNELEGDGPDTPLEKRLDEKTCTNGACAIQNWLRAKAIKHVKEIGSAEKLREDGDSAQKHIKYYKNTKDKRIIDINKAPVWPGDLIIFGNPEKAGFRSKFLGWPPVKVLKDPKDKIFAPTQLIGWTGHTATIAELYADNNTITHVDLIEAHMSEEETIGTIYRLDDVHYWGVKYWGFVATTTRSTELKHWDNIWKDWWFYHYFVYMLLTKQLSKVDKPKKEEWPRARDWWYYKEIKKTHHTDQMMEEKANEELELATDLLADQCGKRGRSPLDVKKALEIDTRTSFLDVYGLAYWVEPKSPS